MGDGEPDSASPALTQEEPKQAAPEEAQQEASSSTAAGAKPAAPPDIPTNPPAASASETDLKATPSEHLGSPLVRPVSQRLSGGSPEASAGPLSTSGSPAEQPSAGAPRKSAWSPYRAAAGSLPALQAPREGDITPPRSDAVPAGSGGSPARQPLQPSRPMSLPVQSSLEVLHDAAVSAAEGFLQREETTRSQEEAAMNEEEATATSAAEGALSPGHRFLTGSLGGEGGQARNDAMETLQAAAGELFRRLYEGPGSPQVGEGTGQQLAANPSDDLPLGFGSRFPSMAGSSPTAAGNFLEAVRAASSAAAGSQSHTFSWQHPALQMPAPLSAERQQPGLQGVIASASGAAAREKSGEMLPKGWAEAAASLLGSVGPTVPLTSAFSDALASREGQLRRMAEPRLQAPQPPRGNTDWTSARLGSAGSDPAFSLPLTAWRLGSGPEGLKLAGSLPTSSGSEGAGLFKAPGPVSVPLLTPQHAPSLSAPGTPPISNMPSPSSLSPPLSPQHNQEGTLGRQLEAALVRQVQLQEAKRNAPATALLIEDPSSGVPVINPRFGPVPWPHTSQHSLDSQVSRMQLAQRAVDRAEFFKVPGNLANFMKQASVDSAVAAFQQREATSPTPYSRQLPSTSGAAWPFGGVPPFRSGGATPAAQLDSSPQRPSALTLQSPLLRSQLGGLAAEHPTQRLHASQQMFRDFGAAAAAGPAPGDAALADSLYASVARQLQSGAGPAVFPQAQQQNVQAAAEEAAAAAGAFVRLDSRAALGPGGGNPYGDLQQQVNMLDLLGLLRAGLASQEAASEVQTGNAPKRKRPAAGGGGAAGAGGAPAPAAKRSANNKCEECGTTETPTWRRWGPTLLCNACGLRRKKSPRSAAARQPSPPAAPPAGQPGTD